jgi:hypothetical protein
VSETADPVKFRLLCAELLAAFEKVEDVTCHPVLAGPLMRVRAALDEPEPNISEISDGYHTFAELYEHRHALCLALMKASPELWWFSRRHSDGEFCFGSPQWFIVGAELPGSGPITYHLPMEYYPIALRTGATSLPQGKPWDGHSSKDVVNRLLEWSDRKNSRRFQRNENEPLWKIMDQAETEKLMEELSTGVSFADPIFEAVRIRALADRTIPEENEPVVSKDGKGWEEWYRWSERRNIRQYLLSEAENAEKLSLKEENDSI